MALLALLGAALLSVAEASLSVSNTLGSNMCATPPPSPPHRPRAPPRGWARQGAAARAPRAHLGLADCGREGLRLLPRHDAQRHGRGGRPVEGGAAGAARIAGPAGHRHQQRRRADQPGQRPVRRRDPLQRAVQHGVCAVERRQRHCGDRGGGRLPTHPGGRRPAAERRPPAAAAAGQRQRPAPGALLHAHELERRLLRDCRQRLRQLLRPPRALRPGHRRAGARGAPRRGHGRRRAQRRRRLGVQRRLLVCRSRLCRRSGRKGPRRRDRSE